MGKSVLIAIAVLTAGAPSFGQTVTSDPAALMTAEREGLKAFAWMDGEWRGTAVTQTPTGEHRVTHTERVGTLLGGTVRLIEGHSYRSDGSTGFNAFAMLAFDPTTRTYKMTSHAEGRYGAFAIVPTASGYSWEIPAGPMTIRYTATFKNGTWTEIGERVAPGKPIVSFFKMELRRTGNSAWPSAGSIKPN